MRERRERVRARVAIAFAAASVAATSGCYTLHPSEGGGEIKPPPGPAPTSPGDVLLPSGYVIEKVASGFTYPTGVAFDEQGTPYVVEAGYAYGEVFTAPRLLRVERDGRFTVVLTGKGQPWNGIARGKGAFFIAAGGELDGGQILRVTADGNVKVLAEGLPGLGDHHTDGPAVGPDGLVYFGQGTATNSGVVGEDNADYGWLKRHPDFHDIPCKDVKLTGENIKSHDPLKGGEAETGAFSPFGTTTTPGQVIPGKVPCSGAVLRVAPEGGPVELVAWGFRNPFGLAFAADGGLYVTDNGFDERGSRPIFGAADYLWAVKPGAFYGWPDFSGGESVAQNRFKPPGKVQPKALLADPPRVPKPVAMFGVHSSSNGFDFSRSEAFGHVGDAFVAQFGDLAEKVGKVLAPVGFKVVRVDVKNGVIEDFATNRGPTNGPASKLKTGGLERPIAARFDPSGAALYVVDYGIMTVTDKGIESKAGSGALWKISRRAP